MLKVSLGKKFNEDGAMGDYIGYSVHAAKTIIAMKKVGIEITDNNPDLVLHLCPAHLANKVEDALRSRTEPLTVAVMGCIVNGPGEAREADLGIAGGKGEALLFKKGTPFMKVKEADLFETLIKVFDEISKSKS